MPLDTIFNQYCIESCTLPTMSITGLTADNIVTVTTMHSITRFPVFLMGVYAGELCVRHSEGTLPWPSTYFRFFPRSSVDTGEEYSLIKLGEVIHADTVQSDGNKVCADTLIWKSRATKQAVMLSALFFLCIIM